MLLPSVHACDITTHTYLFSFDRSAVEIQCAFLHMHEHVVT